MILLMFIKKKKEKKQEMILNLKLNIKLINLLIVLGLRDYIISANLLLGAVLILLILLLLVLLMLLLIGVGGIIMLGKLRLVGFVILMILSYVYSSYLKFIPGYYILILMFIMVMVFNKPSIIQIESWLLVFISFKRTFSQVQVH